MPMKRKIITLLLAVIVSANLFGQVPSKEWYNFFDYTFKNIKKETFKDSTALYTVKIEISVDKRNNYVPSITNNDTTVARNLIGLEALKEYDYKGMMGKNSFVKFILPVAIVILDSKYNNCIDPQVTGAISKMFHPHTKNDDNKTIIYLPPILKEFDKQRYH